jgi:hypothetical protein
MLYEIVEDDYWTRPPAPCEFSAQLARLKDKPRFWDDPRIASTMLEWMLGCGSTCR